MASEWPLPKEERVVFGHPTGYWLALQARADELGVADLRGRQAFYESRLDQIAAFRAVKVGKMSEGSKEF
jgi:hypothetical protein